MIEKGISDEKLESEEDRQLRGILSILIYASLGMFLFVCITGILYGDYRLIAATLLGCAGLIIPMGLLKRRHLQASSLFTTLIILVAVTFFATIGQGIHDLAIVSFPILLIFAGMVLARKYFLLVVGLMFVSIGWLFLGETFGWFIPVPFTGGKWIYLISVTIILVIAALAVDLLARNVRWNLERAQTEIDLRKTMEEEIRNLSLTDELTGLYNRRGFTLLAEQEVKRANRNKRSMLLVFCDVDNFKAINDTLGHTQGDLALKEVSAILKKNFREADIVARIGGDEFVVLAVDASLESADILMNRIQYSLEKSNQQGNWPYQLSFSLGIARYDPEAPCTIDELITRADDRMYQQKRARKGES
jgi:diguanylate cyclase (GGDEF)-like protein